MSILEKLRNSRAAAAVKATESFENEKKTRESPFYYPVLSPDKSASVILRLLPSLDPDQLPYVLAYKHVFKGDDGRWLFQDLCPTTYNGKCPICECNTKLWNTGDEQYRNIARGRSRRKQYIANIYVISDPASPEKEGKVYPFSFGPEIFGIIKNAVKPEFEDEEACMPFDIWEDGADFNLKVIMQKDKGMITYSKSKFINKGKPFLGGDEKAVEAVLSQVEPLSKWIDPSRSRSREDIMRACASAYLHTLDITAFETEPIERPQPKPVRNEVKEVKTEPVKKTIIQKPDVKPEDGKKPVKDALPGDEDDDLEYFRSIASQ